MYKSLHMIVPTPAEHNRTKQMQNETLSTAPLPLPSPVDVSLTRNMPTPAEYKYCPTCLYSSYFCSNSSTFCACFKIFWKRKGNS